MYTFYWDKHFLFCNFQIKKSELILLKHPYGFTVPKKFTITFL